MRPETKRRLGPRRRLLLRPIMGHPTHGFTLVELVVVMALGGIVAAALTVFMRPALETWLTTRARASVAAQANLALQRMVRDVRAAVPNSIRTPDPQCFELVPTSTGGRARVGPDTVNDSAPGCSPSASCSAALDTSQATTTLDVLSPLGTLPTAGDWVVIDNQNAADVYVGTNRARITAVAVPNTTQGRHRLTLASTQFSPGYDSGRFTVVPAAQQAVFYVCRGADGTLDAAGNGKGSLMRLQAYGFNAAYPASCPAAPIGDVLATQVRSCRFLYDPNQGATQQHGYVALELQITRNQESATLVVGAHVVNVP